MGSKPRREAPPKPAVKAKPVNKVVRSYSKRLEAHLANLVTTGQQVHPKIEYALGVFREFLARIAVDQNCDYTDLDVPHAVNIAHKHLGLPIEARPRVWATRVSPEHREIKWRIQLFAWMVKRDREMPELIIYSGE